MMSAPCIGCRCAFVKFKRDRVAPLWKSTYRSVLFLFSQLTKYTYYVKAKKNIKTHAAKTHHRSIRSARTTDDSSTNADGYSDCPTCTKPIVTCWRSIKIKVFCSVSFQFISVAGIYYY